MTFTASSTNVSFDSNIIIPQLSFEKMPATNTAADIHYSIFVIP